MHSTRYHVSRKRHDFLEGLVILVIFLFTSCSFGKLMWNQAGYQELSGVRCGFLEHCRIPWSPGWYFKVAVADSFVHVGKVMVFISGYQFRSAFLWRNVFQWLKTGFGLVIGFINHLQVVTTTKYNTITDFHTTNHSTLIFSVYFH
jgi:type IV secretory pathway TrbD component